MSPAKRSRLRLRKQAKEFRTRPVEVFHSFADLKKFVPFIEVDQRHFLDGSFIWEFGNHRTRELLETPEGMAARLEEIDILEAT